jgi:hypothetical protein
MKTLRKVATIAAAISALLALGAAGPAQASSFTAPKAGEGFTNKTTVQHVFTVTGSEVKCESDVFEGVTEGTVSEGKVHSETMTVHPVTSGCTGFGFPATVSTTPSPGCHYTLGAATTAGMGSMTIVGCTAEAGGVRGILFKVSVAGVATCEVVVPNQTIPSAVSYENVSLAPAAVKVTFTATGIEVDVVTSTGSCPLTKGVHTKAMGDGATYTGVSDFSTAGGFTYTP